MVITYHRGEFFKVSFGDITLAFNPISKDSKLKTTKFGSDIALITINHPDMNGVDQVSHGDRAPFVISGPGEYEIKDTFIRGFGSPSKYGGEERINTVYFVQLEGMKLCFLGALGSKDLSPEIKQNTDDIDILFVPIGGEGVLEPSDAHELAVGLEPRLVIPMHYSSEGAASGGIGMKDALKLFLKEEGSDAPSPVDKLTLKRKDLEGKEGELVLLSC